VAALGERGLGERGAGRAWCWRCLVTELEGRNRRLLGILPAAYRAEYGEEMLMAGADPG
jgi:hypothetical protein